MMIKEFKVRTGFTLIELIMVIVVLGILAAVAIPNYFNLGARANNAAEQGVVGGVRAGISTLHASNVSAVPPIVPNYPATLDAVPASTVCGSGAVPVQCFVNVLGQGGITDSAWSRTAVANQYQHTGVNNSIYTYTPATGTFLCTATCP